MIANVTGAAQTENVYPSTQEDLNTGGASWVQDVGTVRVFTGSAGTGYFEQGNWIYVGATWGTATKTGVIRFVAGTFTDPMIYYVLLTGSDFAALDAVKEWTGSVDDASCTAGAPADALNFGHFSVNPGVNVVLYTYLWITYPTVAWGIVYKNGAGTLPNSVGLTGDQASTPIQWIEGAFQWYSVHLFPRFFADLYTGGATKYVSTPDVIWGYDTGLVTSGDMVNMGSVQGLRAYLAGTPGTGRAAVSVDGGANWLAFDNATQTWITIALSALETSGMHMGTAFPSVYVLDNAGVVIPADDSSASPPEGWGTLRTAMIAEGAGLDFSVAVGLRTNGNVLASIEGIYFDWRYPDVTRPHSIGVHTGMGGGYATADFTLTRDDTTHATFYRSGFGAALEKVHLQVWT